MKKRILSGLLMFGVMVPVLYLGGLSLYIAVCILALLSFKELIDVRKKDNIPNIIKYISGLCLVLLTTSNVGNYSIMFGLSYQTLSLVFLLILAPTIFLTKYKYTISDAFYIASITIFVGSVFNLVIMLYNESALYLIYILVVSMSTDIFALFGGVLIGKHKLTKISPNKTVEGAIIGCLMSVVISTTFYVTFISSDKMFLTILISMILSIVGQIGDLFFSLIKRENEVKDFSNLIPGHGGLLDRIDSAIFIVIAYVFIIQFL